MNLTAGRLVLLSYATLIANSIGILTGLLCYRIWSLYRPRLVKSLYSIR